MANLIIVCGPQAVGKMTVAESLRDKLKYNLMINHDSIEVSNRIFGYNTPAQRELKSALKKKVFELAVKHDVDLIYTYVCAFDDPDEKVYLQSLADQFQASGGQFYLVELSADLATRLKRNVTPHRLERKPTKRDAAMSRADLLNDAQNHRLNSVEGEKWFENHIKIDNTHLLPDEVAAIVIDRFHLTANDKAESEYRFGN